MKIRAILVVLFAATFSLYAGAQASNEDFSHDVPVVLGKTTLQPGDSITIDAIHGSADTISAGNVYRIDGHYTLASQAEAQLAINVTNGEGDSHVPGRRKDALVVHGDGSFSLYFRMNAGGDAHMSFYPAHGGSSFASIYFNPTDKWAMAESKAPITDSVTR